MNVISQDVVELFGFVPILLKSVSNNLNGFWTGPTDSILFLVNFIHLKAFNLIESLKRHTLLIKSNSLKYLSSSSP